MPNSRFSAILSFAVPSQPGGYKHFNIVYLLDLRQNRQAGRILHRIQISACDKENMRK